MRALLAVGALVLGLSACSTPTATIPDARPTSTATPRSTPTVAPDPAPDPAPSIDEVFFMQVESLRTALDEWHDEWLHSGCTDVTAATELECSTQLAGGVAIAQSLDGLFTGLGVDDFFDYPQLVDLDPPRSYSMYSAWRGGLWIEQGCAAEPSADCADLTWNVVNDLTGLHEQLMLWSR